MDFLGNTNKQKSTMDPLSALGAGIGTAGQLIGQHMANKANRKLQREQLNWNEQMWHMQNQYNTPEAQMQRMRDAGLNPNLALGGMGGGNAGSPVESVAPAHMGNVMEGFDPVGQYFAIKNAAADIENKKSERELKSSQIELNELEAITKGMNNREKQSFYEDYIFNRDVRRNSERVEYATQVANMQIRQLELKGKPIEIQRQILQKNAESIHLAYLEFEKAMNLAKGRAEIRRLDAVTNFTEYELDYIKDKGWRIPTKMLPGVFGRIFGGGTVGKEIERILKENTKKSYPMFGKDAQPGDIGWGGIPYIPKFIE